MILAKWVNFAWKNVWRNRRRSITTMMITAFGVSAIVFFGGFVLYTYQSLEEFSARQQGHVIFAKPGYFKKEQDTSMAIGIDNWQQVQAELQNDERVKRVLPRVYFSGLVTNGEQSTIFIADGVDAHREFTVSGPFIRVTEGQELNPDNHDMPEVMVAIDLAKTLEVKVGDIVTVLSTTQDGTLNGMDVRVCGLFTTGVPEIDKRKIMLSLPDAQDLLRTKRVSVLSSYLYNTTDTLLYAEETRAQFSQLEAKTWIDLAFFYHKVKDLYDRIFSTVGIVIVIVVFLSIVNTVSMTVMERTREIGTLSALGTYPRELLLNFILEATHVGVLGSLIGMVISGALTIYLKVFPIMMPPPPGMTDGYPLDIVASPTLYAITALTMIAVSIIGAYVTARKAVRKPIVEALSYV